MVLKQNQLEVNDGVEGSVCDLEAVTFKRKPKMRGSIKSILRHATKAKKKPELDETPRLQRRNSKVRWEIDDTNASQEDDIESNKEIAEPIIAQAKLVVCIQDENAGNGRTSTSPSNGGENHNETSNINMMIEGISSYSEINEGGDFKYGDVAGDVAEEAEVPQSTDTNEVRDLPSNLEPVVLNPTISYLPNSESNLTDTLFMRIMKEASEAEDYISSVAQNGHMTSSRLGNSAKISDRVKNVDRYKSIDESDSSTIHTESSIVVDTAQRVTGYVDELLSIFKMPQQRAKANIRDTYAEASSYGIPQIAVKNEVMSPIKNMVNPLQETSQNDFRDQPNSNTKSKNLPSLSIPSADKYIPVDHVATPSPRKTARPYALFRGDPLDTENTAPIQILPDDLSPLSTKSARSTMFAKERNKLKPRGRKKTKPKSYVESDDDSDSVGVYSVTTLSVTSKGSKGRFYTKRFLTKNKSATKATDDDSNYITLETHRYIDLPIDIRESLGEIQALPRPTMSQDSSPNQSVGAAMLHPTRVAHYNVGSNSNVQSNNGQQAIGKAVPGATGWQDRPSDQTVSEMIKNTAFSRNETNKNSNVKISSEIASQANDTTKRAHGNESAFPDLAKIQEALLLLADMARQNKKGGNVENSINKNTGHKPEPKHANQVANSNRENVVKPGPIIDLTSSTIDEDDVQFISQKKQFYSDLYTLSSGDASSQPGDPNFMTFGVAQRKDQQQNAQNRGNYQGFILPQNQKAHFRSPKSTFGFGANRTQSRG